jgi:mono/diheme cytochrome c family protein
LIATYESSAGGRSVRIVQIDPTIALSVAAEEAPHPRLSASETTVRWEGYLVVHRSAVYRFSGRVRGKFRLSLDGKAVLNAKKGGEEAQIVQGPETQLEAGPHVLIANFTRAPGFGRAEVFWQAPQFRAEPLPYNLLGHLPAQESAELAQHQVLERGRFLVEEYNCKLCHHARKDDRVANGLVTRQGPDLSRVGERLKPGWLFAWLEAPHKQRPGAIMPQLFAADHAGRLERYAVARYLASLGGPLQPSVVKGQKAGRQSGVARGQRLFGELGCNACHTTERSPPSRATREGSSPWKQVVPLIGLGAKTTSDKLAVYLTNPLAVDPSGRMPHMLLREDEARSLAEYIVFGQGNASPQELPAMPTRAEALAAFQQVESRAETRVTFERLSADQQWHELGKRVVLARGCTSCHKLAPSGHGLTSIAASVTFDGLKEEHRHQSGCLAETGTLPSRSPRFGFGKDERLAIRAFLKDGVRGAGSPAPMHSARVALQRFNCLACHVRNGVGGLSPLLVEELRKAAHAESSESISPPPLTCVGHKLRTPWLRQVLTQAGRARPWMAMRMPQFGEANVGWLPEALTRLEGAEPDNSVHPLPISAAQIAAGRQLVGKSGLSCISCHDIAGVATAGTRGPDLASMNLRVRYDWYRNWLEQPQRLQPNTRMPSVFTNGKSVLPTVLGGDADAQAGAIWSYLALGQNLPLPEGLEPPAGVILTPKDRPVLLRTFMPDAGARALAVGYPGGTSIAFDAARCRLVYAWSGSFLDASPVWNDRGGNPAHVLGVRFWTAPPACPIAVSISSDPPDFLARARDPSLGAHFPEGEVLPNRLPVHFGGYTLDSQGRPAFSYKLDLDGGRVLDVVERPEPLHHSIALGLERRFQLAVPPQVSIWMLAAETGGEPQAFDIRGRKVFLNGKTGRIDLESQTRYLRLTHDGDRALILDRAEAPEGARWYLLRVRAGWQALLRLPASSASTRLSFNVRYWLLPRDDDGLIREIIPTK